MTTRPPVREGHFVLESGLHTDRWVDLDGLFVDGAAIAPSVHRLAALLAPFAPTALCGPLDGGAFLAQDLARHLALPFLHARRVDAPGTGLFAARYDLPPVQRAFAEGRRIALVDDMISAGSSTRATQVSLMEAGATVVVVGALFLSGDVAERHFAAVGVPLVAVERHPLHLWTPDDCPACRGGIPLTRP